MEFKPGDLGRTKANLWPMPSRLSDSNGRYNRELVELLPSELNNALVEIIHVNNTYLMVRYVIFDRYANHFKTNILPLNEQVPEASA